MSWKNILRIVEKLKNGSSKWTVLNTYVRHTKRAVVLIMENLVKLKIVSVGCIISRSTAGIIIFVRSARRLSRQKDRVAMNKIVGGKLLREDGTVEHDNIEGYLTNFRMSILSPTTYEKRKDGEKSYGMDMVNGTYFVLVFEESPKKHIPLKDVEHSSNLQPCKFVPGSDNVVIGWSGKPLPLFRLASVSSFGPNKENRSFGYTYIGATP
jgi:hypothetical protein